MPQASPISRQVSKIALQNIWSFLPLLVSIFFSVQFRSVFRPKNYLLSLWIKPGVAPMMSAYTAVILKGIYVTFMKGCHMYS